MTRTSAPAGTYTSTSSSGGRRDDILEAALRCFDRRGVSATTVEDIRVESGASIGSIYHHFTGRDDLLAALYVDAVAAWRDGVVGALASDPDPRGGLGAAVRFHLAWIDAHPALARLTLRWDESELPPDGRDRLRAEARRFGRELDGWVRRGVADGKLRSLAPDLYGALLMGPLLDFARRMASGSTAVAWEEAAEVLAAGIWASLSPAPDDPSRR